jgi:hypothetical protein
MSRLFPLLTGLFTVLILCGCSIFGDKDKELPPLPEPATNNGLAGAEKELDKATAERLSKVSASVGMSYVLATNNAKTPNNDVLLSELKLAKTLVGKSEEKDWSVTKARVESVLKGTPIADAYKKEQEEAVALREKLKEADQKYEAEKAKKQAEYESKLKEREQALAQEKELRRLDAEEARKDRFLYLGGLISVIGIGMLVFGSKAMGIQLFASGVAVSSMPFIWDSPYFIYIAGAFALLGLIAVGRVVFRKKTPCEANQPPADKPTE